MGSSVSSIIVCRYFVSHILVSAFTLVVISFALCYLVYNICSFCLKKEEGLLKIICIKI